jgi:serine/threonine protein kinase
MWVDELRWLQELVSRAGGAVEVFDSLKYDLGGTQEERLTALEIDYERFAGIANPTRAKDAPAARELAEAVLASLQKLRREAIVLITGVSVAEESSFTVQYKDSDPYRSPSWVQPTQGLFTIETEKSAYRVDKKVARGDLSQVYQGDCVRGEYMGEPVAIKLVVDPGDNDLMLDEVSALHLFESSKASQLKQLPVLLDTFKTSDEKSGAVFRLLEGYDAISIRERYINGLPVNHAIWIFRRLLSVVGFAHSQGVIHGNIEPSHIMVRPQDHNVTLIDWCYSIIAPAKTGKGFKCFNPEYSAPEVAEKRPPLPASDLYSVGKCMVYLLGGDLATNGLPASVDPKLQRLVKFFVRTSPLQRAQDAWEMYDELGRLRKDLFGPHSFEVFEM